MNLQKITDLRDHLVKNVTQDSFDMSEWMRLDDTRWRTLHAPIPTVTDFKDHHCGTVACLAGHTLIANHTKEKQFQASGKGIDDEAATILGLSGAEKSYMFHAHWFDVESYLDSENCQADNAADLLQFIEHAAGTFKHGNSKHLIGDLLKYVPLDFTIEYLNEVIKNKDIFVKVSPSKNYPDIDYILEEY